MTYKNSEGLLTSHYPNNPEKTAKSIFEAQRYKVLNLEPGSLSNNIIKDEKEIDGRVYKILENKIGENIKPGTPDLFCYETKENATSAELKNYFYVEVKSKNDGLRPNQIEFLSKTEIKSLIMIVKEDSYKIHNADISSYGVKQ